MIELAILAFVRAHCYQLGNHYPNLCTLYHNRFQHIGSVFTEFLVFHLPKAASMNNFCIQYINKLTILFSFPILSLVPNYKVL